MAGFEIDGELYAVPALDSFTLAECEILENVSGFRQEDFEPADPTWEEETRKAHAETVLQRIMSPRFKRALAEIAYRRKHPDVSEELRSKLVGDANALDVTIALILGDDEVADPSRDSRSALENVTSISELSKSEGSGSRSESDSDEPETSLEATGLSS